MTRRRRRLLARPSDVPLIARKVAGVAEVSDVRADAGLLETLEEAIGENQRLHARLTVVVDELEQAVVPLLEKAHAAAEARQ